MKAYSITPKGQVTIPVEIREKPKLSPGDRVQYENTPKGILLKPVKWNMLNDFAFLKDRKESGKSLDAVRHEVRKKIAEKEKSE
jgi:AbrB family looped-hinge helix DNA binding protein